MQNLAETVFCRLADDGADEKSIDLILAALEGPERLSEVLDGAEPSERPELPEERVAPDGAYLTKISVEGFRGIGPRADISLTPGPGLTVICGRNGAGKTTFAEALECALTGTAQRWERAINALTAKTSWRNLHHAQPCEIAVGVTEAGRGQATIRVSWATEAATAAQAKRTYQRDGDKRLPFDEAIDWKAALTTFRPVMSYEDLGRFVTDKPSAFHDAIAQALGLDELRDAIVAIKDRIAPLKKPAAESERQRKSLRDRAKALDDPRADSAAAALRRSKPATDEIRLLAAGRDTDSRHDVLTRIALIDPLDLAAMAKAAEELEDAERTLAGLGEQRERLEMMRDALLNEALTYHEAAGDGACPVCGEGTLDESWHSRVSQTVEETNLLDVGRKEAQRRLQQAERTAQLLLIPPPAVLTQTELAIASQSTLSRLWTSWSTAPDDGSLSTRLRTGAAGVNTALEAWQSEARQLANAAEAAWAPFAAELLIWARQHDVALELAATAGQLDRAHGAAVAVETQLRADRLEPITGRAHDAWRLLSKDSNVQLGDITLTGSATRRTVSIKAQVDGVDGEALTVLSQGEQNSFALGLYLARATSEESPFRFLVLDDPVQAMDPTKVEGLAELLADLAETRQIIVFTHDNRLTDAVRRLPTSPTILEVSRGEESRVWVTSSLRPSARYLDDAHALLKADPAPPTVKQRVVPGLLRQAIEAAAWGWYVETHLGAGEPLDKLEQNWTDKHRTRGRLDLLFGDSTSTWLGRDPRFGRAVSACNAGSHGSTGGNLDSMVDDAKSLVAALEGHRR